MILITYKYDYIHILAHNKRNKKPRPVNIAAIADVIISSANDFSFCDLNCNVKNHAVNINPTLINPMKYCKKLSTSIGPSKYSNSIFVYYLSWQTQR